MENASSPSPPCRRGPALPKVALLLACVVVMVCSVCIAYLSSWNPQWWRRLRPDPRKHLTLLGRCQGIKRPTTVSAKEARLEDDDEVVGVIVEGAARAYSVKALGEA